MKCTMLFDVEPMDEAKALLSSLFTMLKSFLAVSRLHMMTALFSCLIKIIIIRFQKDSKFMAIDVKVFMKAKF